MTQKRWDFRLHGITNTQEIAFFSVCWLVAFSSAFFRAIRDNEYGDFWHALSIGCTAGFFSFGVVAILSDAGGGDPGGNWYFVGVSTLIGLLAKEQDRIARSALSKVTLIARVFTEDGNRKDDDDSEKLV